MMSKWLGADDFPYGVYGDWPPAAPKDLLLVCSAAPGPIGILSAPAASYGSAPAASA